MALTVDPTSQWLVLSLVLDKLLEPIDIVRFGAVCRQWNSSAKTYLQTNPKRRNQKPLLMLMIPPPLEGKSSTRTRIYSLSETEVYDNINLSLPSYTKRCCGSSYGWLATVEDERLAITLHNPFCQSIDPIRLPPLDTLLIDPVPLHHKASGLYEHYVAKVVLSADPILSPDDYVVAVIYDVCTRLAFIKKGQTSWTIVTTEEDEDCLFPTDLLFHRGKLYAVGWFGYYILAVDCNDHDSNNNKPQGRTLFPNKDMTDHASTRDYLVESTKGDLFLLRRLIMDGRLPILETFQIFRLVLDDEENNVVKLFPVTTIGDDEAFFVGNNQSVAVLASNYPCIEPDCIYYTDDLTFQNFRTGPDDSILQRAEIGVFRLSKLFTSRPYKKLNIDWQLRNPPALWINVPSINMSV